MVDSNMIIAYDINPGDMIYIDGRNVMVDSVILAGNLANVISNDDSIFYMNHLDMVEKLN